MSGGMFTASGREGSQIAKGEPQGLHGLVALRTTLLPWTLVMYAQYPREAQQTALGGLICLLFILCALGTIQAAAQNAVGEHLLELDDDERNAAFSLMLKDSERRCDKVIRTLFNGTVLGVDDWRRCAKTETPTRSASLESRTRPSSGR
jgi:hypothetical protein